MTDIISLQNIYKTYPSVNALNGVSFKVNKGEIHGFLGPNGAGKSTTMKIITGLIPATSGSAQVKGVDIRKNLTEIKSIIGFLPESLPLYQNMTVEKYLLFVGKINGCTGSELKKNLDETLKQCGLTDCKKRLINNLSKGFKQRVGIAQAIIYRPEIIILDEPMVGLDPISIVDIRDLIISLRENHTIILSTHQLHEANKICSDISIINEGEIIQSGPINTLHAKFRRHQVIWAEVQRWNDLLLAELKQKFNLLECEVIKEEVGYGIKFLFDGIEDIRSRLSEFLIQKKCGLLFYQEEKLDLEDIFKIALEGEK